MKTAINQLAEKGISNEIVNALTYSLTVEVQREGYIYCQDYNHGIPQSDLITEAELILIGMLSILKEVGQFRFFVNAVIYFAKQGYDVDEVDLSKEAMRN